MIKGAFAGTVTVAIPGFTIPAAKPPIPSCSILPGISTYKIEGYGTPGNPD